MILSRFRWYRRARGGYWAQVTGLMWGKRWVHCPDGSQPTPDKVWEFYPWARKEMSNGYIDEWVFVDPCYAVPLSMITKKAIAALKTAVNSVECASVDPDGKELPWHKQAMDAITDYESDGKSTL